jgi:hypothetical protein
MWSRARLHDHSDPDLYLPGRVEFLYIPLEYIPCVLFYCFECGLDIDLRVGSRTCRQFCVFVWFIKLCTHILITLLYAFTRDAKV